MMTMESTLTPEQRRTLIHVEREKGHTYADIAPAVELLAEKLSQLPQSVVDAKVRELAAGVRSNGYAGTCRDCRTTVPAGEGGLVKSGGSWVTYHIDPCPAPAPVAETATPADETPKPARTNGYAGKCVDCGTQVPAGEGELFRNGGWKVRHFPKGSCPEVIDESATANGYEPTKGDVHVIDGEYFRVHVSQTSGKFYGAIWNGSKFLGAARDKRASGSLGRMTEETLITAEQAAEFGHMNEECIFCSHAIDTPESTAVGYGPSCAEKRGLPWG